MTSHKGCFVVIVLVVTEIVQCNKDCWTSFNAQEHFEIMDTLDDRYEKVRTNFQKTVGGRGFDKDMLVAMLKSRGIAERALYEVKGDENMIPAGINLGGYCMMKMPKSVLFFHRMKLRNNTMFRVTNIYNDFANLVMIASISLNDLHLFGSYDLTIATKPGHLAYEPTFGQVELLLKNVRYKMEGRYRFSKKRLSIELIISELLIDDILMMYKTKNSTPSLKLHRKNINVFIERLQVDLDKWLKDYFNDYLMYYVVVDDDEFLNYNREKTIALNHFTDNAINTVIKRIHDIKADAVQLPAFTIFVSNDKEVRLRDGILRGLDSIYRRAIATGTKEKYIRKVDTVVGFSDLKLIYRYDAILKSGLPPVTGILILNADELTAHMGLRLVNKPDTADLSFRFLEQAKPESLTVEGPANRMISNFKYLLERHIIAIMSNTLMHNINMLGTLDKCIPLLLPSEGSNDQNISEEQNREDNMLVNITGSFEAPFEKSNVSRDDSPAALDPRVEGSDENQPPNSREDNMLVNITSSFEAALEKSNVSPDHSPANLDPTDEGSDENQPPNSREDNMLVNITSSFETALEKSNISRDKALIGVHDADNKNALRNFKYYHKRLPLRVVTLKRNVNHFKKSVKQKM